MKIAHKKGVAKKKRREREINRERFEAMGLRKPKAKKPAKKK